jgi:hypothetical protein
MVVQAWSFLISRNQSLDYRTIVAPDFMTEINLSGKLSMIVVDEEQTEDGYVHYSEIHSAKFGDLSLIYHTFKSNKKDIVLDSDSILTDKGGREINSVEGIVLRGRTPNILITNHTFKEIHKSLMFTYKDFWSLSEFTCPYSSVPFELGFNHPNEISPQFIHHNPYILDTPKNSLCAKWIRVKNLSTGQKA